MIAAGFCYTFAMKIVGIGKRLIGVAFFAIGIFVYVLMFRTGSSPAGYGTHTRLGLPACSYLATKHYPCPGCGVTTASANMARGQVVEALRASLFGALAFLAIMAIAVAGLVQAVTGRDVLMKFWPRSWVIALIVVLFFASWGLKTGLGILDGIYPIR